MHFLLDINKRDAIFQAYINRTLSFFQILQTSSLDYCKYNYS